VGHLFFLRQHPRQITTLFSAAVALAASLALGRTTGWVDGFFYDLSLTVQGARPGTGGEPVAVIAIDGSSLDSEELAATPRVFFGAFRQRRQGDWLRCDFQLLGQPLSRPKRTI
jgi:hypothetical protein